MSSSNPNKRPKRSVVEASKKKVKEKVSHVANVEGWLSNEKDKDYFKHFGHKRRSSLIIICPSIGWKCNTFNFKKFLSSKG